MSLNYTLSQLPERAVKPRESGITMVMDKGFKSSSSRGLSEQLLRLYRHYKTGLWDINRDS